MDCKASCSCKDCEESIRLQQHYIVPEESSNRSFMRFIAFPFRNDILCDEYAVFKIAVSPVQLNWSHIVFVINLSQNTLHSKMRMHIKPLW